MRKEIFNAKLISVVLMCTSPIAAYAEDKLKVKLGGIINTQVGYVKESSRYRNEIHAPLSPLTGAPVTNNNVLNNKAVTNDTLININIDGKWNSDTDYGGLIRLHANQSQAVNGETTVGDKTMIYIQNNKIGRFEAGNFPGAGAMFEMDVPGIDTGTAGVDGYWSQWVAGKTKKLPGYFTSLADVQGSQYITNPNIPSNYSGKYYSDAPKVTFYTKPLTGLTVGLSYIPDMDSRGTVSGIAYKNASPTDEDRKNNPPTFREIFSGGGTYEYAFNQDWSTKLGLSLEAGKAKDKQIRDLKAMEANIMLKYKDMKLTSSYGDAGKTFTLKNPLPGTKHKANYWTVAFGHQIDKFGYSIAYMNSKRAGGLEAPYTMAVKKIPILQQSTFSDYRSNKLDLVTLDVDYKLAQGLLPYAGIAGFKFRGGSNAFNSNQKDTDKGYVVMAGTKLSF